CHRDPDSSDSAGSAEGAGGGAADAVSESVEAGRDCAAELSRLLWDLSAGGSGDYASTDRRDLPVEYRAWGGRHVEGSRRGERKAGDELVAHDPAIHRSAGAV